MKTFKFLPCNIIANKIYIKVMNYNYKNHMNTYEIESLTIIAVINFNIML